MMIGKESSQLAGKFVSEMVVHPTKTMSSGCGGLSIRRMVAVLGEVLEDVERRWGRRGAF